MFIRTNEGAYLNSDYIISIVVESSFSRGLDVVAYTDGGRRYPIGTYATKEEADKNIQRVLNEFGSPFVIAPQM